MTFQIPLPAAAIVAAVVFAMSACFFFCEDDQPNEGAGAGLVYPEAQQEARIKARVGLPDTASFSPSARFKLVYVVAYTTRATKGELYRYIVYATAQAVEASDAKVLALWRHRGYMKVALKVQDADEVRSRVEQAAAKGIPASVCNSGIAFIGVDEVTRIDEVCGDLKLL